MKENESHQERAKRLPYYPHGDKCPKCKGKDIIRCRCSIGERVCCECGYEWRTGKILDDAVSVMTKSFTLDGVEVLSIYYSPNENGKPRVPTVAKINETELFDLSYEKLEELSQVFLEASNVLRRYELFGRMT